MTHNLAQKIRALIEEKNMSVQGVEKKAGLSINAVRSILTGQSKKPSAEHLLAISRVLGCTIGELLGEEPAYTPTSGREMEDFLFENKMLASEILLFMGGFFKNNLGHDLSTSKIAQSMQSIYTYCMDTNEGTFDARFAKWFLTRDVRL